MDLLEKIFEAVISVVTNVFDLEVGIAQAIFAGVGTVINAILSIFN